MGDGSVYGLLSSGFLIRSVFDKLCDMDEFIGKRSRQNIVIRDVETKGGAWTNSSPFSLSGLAFGVCCLTLSHLLCLPGLFEMLAVYTTRWFDKQDKVRLTRSCLERLSGPLSIQYHFLCSLR
ncbi:hypothetical protein RRG08_029349 [Elysia crispata]|uniref:Uncharacterized protein n=1 Tax=Elysia crispata TaxID=231223 RepID=A0AAE1ARS3_9GAST|nr:hypothetical protein RRG08_029349 [Elysia crispata]